MLITTDLVMAWRPCRAWPRKRVAAVLGNGLTPLELAARKDVPVQDRIWAFLHEEVIPIRLIAQLICDFIESANYIPVSESNHAAAKWEAEQWWRLRQVTEVLKEVSRG